MTEGGRFSSHLAAFRKAERMLSCEDWFRNGAWKSSVSIYGLPGFERGCGIHLRRLNSEDPDKPVAVDSWITQADLKRRRVPIFVQESAAQDGTLRAPGKVIGDRVRASKAGVETYPFTVDSLADVLFEAIRQRSLEASVGRR